MVVSEEPGWQSSPGGVLGCTQTALSEWLVLAEAVLVTRVTTLAAPSHTHLTVCAKVSDVTYNVSLPHPARLTWCTMEQCDHRK